MSAFRRLPKHLVENSLRIHHQRVRPSHRTLSTVFPKQLTKKPFRTSPSHLQNRTYATKTVADGLIEKITEQYATARDEFEIACEGTDSHSIYAAEDRKAARFELDALKETYELALQSEAGEEIRRRVGQRIRELDNAVQAMEKRGLED